MTEPVHTYTQELSTAFRIGRIGHGNTPDKVWRKERKNEKERKKECYCLYVWRLPSVPLKQPLKFRGIFVLRLGIQNGEHQIKKKSVNFIHIKMNLIWNKCIREKKNFYKTALQDEDKYL